MGNKILVIALGGNALGNNPEEQKSLVKATVKPIVDLVEQGYSIVIGHGNGPQVGMINLAFDYANKSGAKTPLMPFPECGAMSQGYIGYHLQQALQEELRLREIKKEVACIVTQVAVDKNDPAFQNPTKPVGMFYSKAESESIALQKGFTFVEDAGRGYRRVVPSPLPIKIVELNVIKQLVSHGDIVITVGGGGIPVIETNNSYEGVAAVIDKDRASARLALDLEAEMLVILTAVEQVYINFNKANQKALTSMSIEEAKQYILEGQFAPGSMLPKVKACLDYVENKKGGVALITSLEKASSALKGSTGTIIK